MSKAIKSELNSCKESPNTFWPDPVGAFEIVWVHTKTYLTWTFWRNTQVFGWDFLDIL